MPDQMVMGMTRSWFLFFMCLKVATSSCTPLSSSLPSLRSSSPNLQFEYFDYIKYKIYLCHVVDVYLVSGSTKMAMMAAAEREKPRKKPAMM